MAVWLATEFGKGAQGESNVEEPEAGLWFLPFTIHIVTLRALSDNQIIPKLPGELLLEFAPKNLEFYAYSRNAFEVVAPFFLIEVFVTVFQIGSDWFSRKSEHLHCQSGVCSLFEKYCPFCWFCVSFLLCAFLLMDLMRQKLKGDETIITFLHQASSISPFFSLAVTRFFWPPPNCFCPSFSFQFTQIDGIEEENTLLEVARFVACHPASVTSLEISRVYFLIILLFLFLLAHFLCRAKWCN